MTPPSNKTTVEKDTQLKPKFDKNGLITAVATHFATGEVLMVAWMNEEALRKSISTGYANFWSRSRERLWRKGEESGNFLEIKEMHIDCDQDTVWMKVLIQGNGVACHTGARSCFYRKIPLTNNLQKGAFPTLVFRDEGS